MRQYCPFGGVEIRISHGGNSGTLLGPEGSALVSSGGFLGPYIPTNLLTLLRARQAWKFVRDRSYFENFTVDASIFVVTTSY
ncbi:hypothetical protein AFL01nite_30170 [Aeromicrobium flavum]|uniref:Uncharacterized protein n=1 Tax=Aeromicrobium flavum TaxID=416568 RepID=A0A512HZ79_9ACTN|nr:hypothetical protein AFL01nite_30170 [Aeromicrobium flavum]